jgi:hypothetical protein
MASARTSYRDAQRQAQQRLRRTCYHESGHCTIAYIEGVAVRGATVAPYGQYSGRAWIGDCNADYPAAIRIAFGGMIAEAKLCADRQYEGEHAASRRLDHADIRRLALAGGFDHREIAELKDQTYDLICDHWPAVKSLARRLYIYTTLNGAEIENAICDAIDY